MEKEDKSESFEGENEDKTALQNKDSLREFVANECKEQLEKQGNDENIDKERMNQFFQRAISESERMNAEVCKCRVKQQKLYDELGKDLFESWSKDHASQVLTSAQYQSWARHEQHSKELQKKMHNEQRSSDDDSCR